MKLWNHNPFRPIRQPLTHTPNAAYQTQNNIVKKCDIPRSLLYSMALSGLLYIFMCINIPIGLLSNEKFDDAFYVQHAESIFHGNWLGAYNQMTLAKGPGYPLFLALNAASGLPVTLSQAMLYIFACFLLANVIYRLSTSVWISLFAFLAMLWHPAIIPVRTLRADITPAQALLILACVLQFSFLSSTFKQGRNWALFGGFVVGWLWITREDGIWIIPGLFLLFTIRLIQLKLLRRKTSYLIMLMVLFISSACFTWSSVAIINLIKYGTFEVVDFKSTSFEDAVQAIQGVRVGNPEPYVPAPNKVLKAIYAVSPAFSSLKPYFDGPGKGWEAPGGEIPGTAFVWALRDAVASRGFYHSPQQASAFYDLITKQINDACATGKLTCKKNIISPFMPAVTASQWRLVPAKLLKLVKLLSWQEPERVAPNSVGYHDRIETIENFLNRPLRTPSAVNPHSLYVRGWFYPDNDKWIQVKCSGGGENKIIPVDRRSSPDIAAYVKNPSANYQRFTIEIPSSLYCEIQLTGALNNEHTLKVNNLQPGVLKLGGGTLFFDNVKYTDNNERITPAYRVLRYINKVYRMVLPPLILVMLLIYLWRIVSFGKNIDNYVIIIGTILILVATQSVILLFVDISAFSAIDSNYMSAGFPLLCLAIVLSIGSLFSHQHQLASNEKIEKL
ncbi:hypothetical protein [Acidithiobacillus sp.]|uniref:hypothetical protein n=1 Tax=Acidithiobacillus sp. TaxID=1872118 RepID=UPI0025BDA044|nr:hypothetical protein [Acidithiobacillus sp.]MCK9187971.1 hypothetical protein [Acidithiobacillus sp.]MCK9359930.1 hypothetical protein [Acidithiobacillus sp.]